MTVLGSGIEPPEEAKAGDKVLLVAGTLPEFEAVVMPARARLISLKRRRSQLMVALVLIFIIVMMSAIFLTICFIRKIGPFRRHYNGYCPVGSGRFNGHHKVFESYEMTDKYALIHVPKFHFKQDTFDSVRTLHVFDKKVTVIQHRGKCFVKPMMKYQQLQNDWFDNLRKLSHHDFRTPDRFAHFHLRMIRPQLPFNYLKNEIDDMAAAICNDRPVFRLVFQITSQNNNWTPICHIKCEGCDVSDQVTSVRMVGGRKCRVCKCARKDIKTVTKSPLMSSNRIDANCKSIRCENKCVNKDLLGCVRCICADAEPERNNKVEAPVVNELQLPPMIVSAEDSGIRKKRSLDVGCKLVANIYEGYTPLDYNKKVALDHIYEC